MTRPIDADVLSHKLKAAIDLGKRCEMDTLELEGVLNYVEAMPTIDAVPVTRCKDCKHWARNDGMFKDFDEREWHHCPHLGIDTDGYFLCIEGERKEE